MRNGLHILLSFFAIFSANIGFAQSYGTISGIIIDRNSQTPIAGVSIKLEGTTIGTTSDSLGKFKLTNIPPASYNIYFDRLGYEEEILFNIVVNTGNSQTFKMEMDPQEKKLDQVEVVAHTFGKKTETPLSVQSVTAEEIKANPGGNFDISRVLQALPGVGSTAGTGSYRNDIIIRGGGPNENVYYLDGIETPVINHFSTQGSAGGPTGILNVSFIEDATLSSSSFGAKYDNALSSVLEFKQKDGNPDKIQGNIRTSGTEVAATLDGPVTGNTTFLVSARRSYLQLLFQALDIPIRPSYWDFQYKTTTKIDDKTTLITLGIGAIDHFTTGVPKNSSPENEYILYSTPKYDQWNYTNGYLLKRLIRNGYYNISFSRNMLDNQINQTEYGTSTEILKVHSQEIENKFRLDVNKFTGGWKFSYGADAQFVKYNTDFYDRLSKQVLDSTGRLIQPEIDIKFNDAISFWKFGAFVNASTHILNDRLSISGGLRTDMNTFMNNGMNPLNTLSPRISLSYALADKWNLNVTSGMYYKCPVYTVLGYKDSNGNFANKDNKYIECTHYVAGIEYLPSNSSRITVEGFYKTYRNYPVSEMNRISLSNEGGDFGSIGNERTLSVGLGRAYGVEVFYQQKLTKNFYATVSYTYVHSEFTGINTSIYIPSSWDDRNLVSAILGKKFRHGWEAGLKFRYSGGAPYTPFNLQASRLNYLSLGTGLPDYSMYNTLRLADFNETDLRIDKKYNYKKLTFDIYLDFQNITFSPTPSYPNYTFQRKADNSGWATTDGKPVRPDGSNAIPVILNSSTALVIPTIGFIIEF